jgi:hypothetical protein
MQATADTTVLILRQRRVVARDARRQAATPVESSDEERVT